MNFKVFYKVLLIMFLYILAKQKRRLSRHFRFFSAAGGILFLSHFSDKGRVEENTKVEHGRYWVGYRSFQE